MADTINLLKPKKDTPFVVKTISQNETIINNQAPYLQELQLVGGDIRCCALKNIGSIDKELLIDNSSYKTYRLSMMTLPGIIEQENIENEENIIWCSGLEYVYYTFDEIKKELNIVNKGAPLVNSIHTLIVSDLEEMESNSSELHYCRVNSAHSLSQRPVACFEVLTTFRNSHFKPFHLFYIKELLNLPGEPSGSVYLVPITLSEGIVIYFIMPEANIEDLVILASEVFRTRYEKGDHWCVASEINYNDDLGIFFCTSIKKDITDNDVLILPKHR